MVFAPTLNLRATSEFAADTEEDGTPVTPEPVGLRRPSLPYATPRLVAHPRLIPRADLVARKRLEDRLPTELERPRRRLARSSSPDLDAERPRNEFDVAIGSAPSPMPQPPLFLPARRGALPPPLRHRPAPAPLRPVTQVEDEFGEHSDDMITLRFR